MVRPAELRSTAVLPTLYYSEKEIVMRWFKFAILLFSSLAIASVTALSKDATLSRPHIPRQGKNLIVNPSVKTTLSWTLVRDARYDALTSRKKDGSGSFQLETPLPKSSMALSELIPIRSGQRYTFGFYFKTLNGPTYVGAQISLHDSNRKYLRNHTAALGGTTRDGEWQEFVLPFVVPKDIMFIGLQVYKTDNTKPGGKVWADDFYLGEGLGLEQAPSPKQGFDGAHVRLDALGNFDIKKNGVWTPFFPLCMYSDNYRNWSVYSKQGWNTIIWTGDAQQVKQAKAAVSDFNPDGMMAGFQIAPYTFPLSTAYNNLTDLRSKLRAILNQALDDNLLLYYWDNENNHNQWQVPVNVINTIKGLDVDSSGKRLHPIYALQGSFNIARVHAAQGLVDVSGTYFGGTSTDTGGAGQGGGEEGLFILDRHEKQISPAAFAQFNGVDGSGEMRLRLYNAIILGARAIGYWRDGFGPNQLKEFPSVGPVDKKAWWPDFPCLRREVDRLLPIIREPHWTAWKANLDTPSNVRVGTRNHKGEGYLFLVNQTTRTQTVIVTLDGLPYAATEVRNCFTDKKIASISNGSFSVALPKIGIDSGIHVLRIVSPSNNR